MLNSVQSVSSFAPTESSRPKVPNFIDIGRNIKNEKITQSIHELEKGDTITISDPNNSSGGCFGTPENNRMIITKIGDDKYKVKITSRLPNATYITAPKEKTYIVSEKELSQYIKYDKSMEKFNPTICTFA